MRVKRPSSSLHEARPDLFEKYGRLLSDRLARHRELGKSVGEGGQAAVGKEQLDALRALGYVDWDSASRAQSGLAWPG